MDNLTHSLIGVAIGEGVIRLRRRRGIEEPSRARAGVLWAAVLASNLPDFDILLKPIVGGGSLGNLLHHRGYTHTLVLLPFLAVIAASFGRWVSRRQASWGILWSAAGIGVVLHLFADFWNDYGVHPFWPWNKNWFYGDFMFIVEPLLWGILLTFGWIAARTRTARWVLGAFGIGFFGLVWFRHELPGSVAVFVMAWCVGWAFFLLRAKRFQLRWALAAVFTVLSTFASAHLAVRAQVVSRLPAQERLLWAATSPSPGNPLCWRVILSSVTDSGDYRARLGVVGLPFFGMRGSVNDPSRCFARMSPERRAPLVPVDAPSLQWPGGHWVGEFRSTVSEIFRLQQQHCRIRAIMRFVRIPYHVEEGDGTVIFGDLRYDFGRRLGFAAIQSRAGEPCDGIEPDWNPPSGIASAN